MSNFNIGNTRSVSSGQTREVRRELLGFLLFVAGRVAVRVMFVVGAPFGRRIATFAFALPFAPFGILGLRDTRAVGLVVPISFAPMALNVVGRGGLCCSTSSDGGPDDFLDSS